MVKVISELEVCDHCMIAAVNGDTSGVPDGAPEPLNKITEIIVHACADCESEDSHAFRFVTCDGCGDDVNMVHTFVVLG